MPPRPIHSVDTPRTMGIADIPVAIALAVGAAAISAYRYGRDDQAQYLAHVAALRNPEAFAADPYTDTFGSLASVFWRPFAALSNDAADPWVALTLTIAIGAIGALLLIRLGRSLGLPGPGAYAVPAVLLTPKEENYFGLVTLVDVELTATFAVLPLCVAVIGAWTTRRVWLALSLAAIAVPIHAQTGAALLAMWCAATALERSPRRWLAVALGVLGLIGAVLARGFAPVSPERLDRYESIGRSMYAPLIDLWSVPWLSWGALAMLLSFGFVAAPRVLAARTTPAPSDARRRLPTLALASLVYPALGGALLLMDLQEPLLWRLMIPRSLMLTQLIAMLVVGVWIADRFRDGRPWTGAAVLVGMACWPLTHLGHQFTLLLGLGMLALFLVTTVARPRAASPPVAPAAVASSLCLAVICLVAFILRPHPWTRADQPRAWLEAQSWARAHTPPDAVFVTPPYLAGWRVGSQRTTFGEMRDGGLLFYAGDPLLDWWDRMALLGMDTPRRWWARVDPDDEPAQHGSAVEAYADALKTRWNEIAASGATHVVTTAEGGGPGEVIWANDVFQIRAEK